MSAFLLHQIQTHPNCVCETPSASVLVLTAKKQSLVEAWYRKSTFSFRHNHSLHK